MIYNLVTNAVFGKTIENIQKRQEFMLANNVKEKLFVI